MMLANLSDQRSFNDFGECAGYFYIAAGRRSIIHFRRTVCIRPTPKLFLGEMASQPLAVQQTGSVRRESVTQAARYFGAILTAALLVSGARAQDSGFAGMGNGMHP